VYNGWRALAALVVRFPKTVMAFWAGCALAAVLGIPTLYHALGTPPLYVAGSESDHAAHVLTRAFPELGTEQMIAVLHADRLTTGSEPYDATLDAASRALLAQPGVRSAQPLPPLANTHTNPHIAYLLVGVDGDPSERQQRLPAQRAALEQVTQQASDGRIRAHLVGVTAFFDELKDTDLADLRNAEAVAIAIAALILLLGLRRMGSAGAPLLAAGTAILVAAGVLAALSRVVSVNIFLVASISTTGLALGLDYALLVVSRFGEELQHCATPESAATTTIASAGKTVVYSALAVMASTSTLFLLDAQVIRDCVLAGLCVITVAVAATLTLLPAWLVTRPNWFRDAPGQRKGEHWTRWASHLMRYPWQYIAAGSAALILVTAPATGLHLGFDLDRASLAHTSPGQGLALMERDDFAGAAADITILLPRPPHTPAPGLAALLTHLKDHQLVAATYAIDNHVDATLVSVIPRTGVDSPDTATLIRDLRQNLLPTTLPPGQHALVGGPSAVLVDFQHEIEEAAPWVAVLLLGGAFLFLLVALRSILLPLKAILANLLVTGATFGLLAVVQPGPRTWADTWVVNVFVPLIAFVVLFGLSIDYEIFLVRRMREHYDALRDNSAAVRAGLRDTARPITLAAAVMITVFLSLLTANRTELIQVGFTLAVAVGLDVTIVRLVLVPALMRVLGKWNWWLPQNPLRRLRQRTAAAPVPKDDRTTADQGQ
jgi:putative drug exporter of the RND superfamily